MGWMLIGGVYCVLGVKFTVGDCRAIVSHAVSLRQSSIAVHRKGLVSERTVQRLQAEAAQQSLCVSLLD